MRTSSSSCTSRIAASDAAKKEASLQQTHAQNSRDSVSSKHTRISSDNCSYGTDAWRTRGRFFDVFNVNLTAAAAAAHRSRMRQSSSSPSVEMRQTAPTIT